MELAYTIGGGAPHIKKYRISGGVAVSAGVGVTCDPASDADGVIAVNTVTALNCFGVTTDAATAGTDAQATDGSDNARFVSVCINPDAVWRTKLTQGATEDTALTIVTATSASTDGLLIPTVVDENTVWGYTGANVGHVRRASTTTAVVQAFPHDIAVGDQFLYCQPVEGDPSEFVQLSTLFTQCNAAAASDTDNLNWTPVELQLRALNDDGANNSFALLHCYGHIWGGTTPT